MTKIPDITPPVVAAMEAVLADTSQKVSSLNELIHSAHVPYATPISAAFEEAEIARYKAITALSNALAETVPNSSGNLLVINAFSTAIGAIK